MYKWKLVIKEKYNQKNCSYKHKNILNKDKNKNQNYRNAFKMK